MTAPAERPALAVLRVPRYVPQTSGRHVVTLPDNTHVLTFDVGRRGTQVDVTDPDGAPLGRMTSEDRDWTLVAPFSGEIVAEGAAIGRAWVSVDAGPPASARQGRGEEFDLVWRGTVLVRARKPPRRDAPGCLDIEVFDPRFTPVVVAFAVHVQRRCQADEARRQVVSNTMLVRATMPPPPGGR